MTVNFVRTLFARDRLLAATAALMLAGFVVAGLVAPFDTRSITGINPWIKPMKFLISIAIFLGTIAWFMPELRPAPRARAWITRTIVAMMIIEIVCIVGQAVRGTTSHFNNSTAFDGMVFSLMGAAITVNTIAVAAMIPLMRLRTPPERAGYLWGVRLGMAVFVVGSLLGFVIVENHGHSVPGPDGGPGVFFLNWSLDRGDLRVAHFIGLHAPQALPLVGALLDRRATMQPALRVGTVTALALAWMTLVAVTLSMALSGRPLVAL